MSFLRRHVWAVLFVLLAGTLAVPFYAVQTPPLLDYPNHLARTFVLTHLHDPAYHFGEIFHADWKPYPYILWDVLAVVLQHFIPAEAAGRLLLALATVLLPFSVAWFLHQANPGQERLAFLACPLAYCTLFLWGFTAYQLSVSFCFLMVGTWFWYRKQPTPWRAALFVLSTFLAYFAHLLGFASAAFILVLYELTRWDWRRWLQLSAFLAPPSLLFLWARPGLVESKRLEMRPLADKFMMLVAVPGHLYSDPLDRVFMWGIVLCLGVALVRNRELRIHWRWMFVLVGMFGVYMLLPYGWGTSSDIDVRLVVPFWMLLLAVAQVGRRARWIAVLAVVLTLVRVANVEGGFEYESETCAPMDEAIALIQPGATLFPLVDTCKDDDPLDYFYVHYWAHAVVRRGAISPYLFDIPGQTPMRINTPMYLSEGFWGHCYDVEPDWEQLADDYDYIWSYGDQRYAAHIAGVADKVFERQRLVLYRVRPKS
ncbi:MAG: hypothetical protein P4M01_05950 [Acidobacteriota bacterium]|nr:hypothetical protein [Acidobacteriota bacterium]